MTDEIKYNGYYCVKCKYIPLIQIIPKKENLFILSSCNCNKKYLKFDLFHKNYFKNNISINNIYNISLINTNKEYVNKDILLLKKEFIEIKDEIEKSSKEKIDNLKDYIKEKDPDNLKVKYEQYICINNKIISLIENFFSSLEIIKENPSIKFNIININFNKYFHKIDYTYLIKSSPDIYYEKSLNFFKEEFIISQNSLGEQLIHKFFKSQNNSVLCFLEITNTIYVSNVKNSSNIYLYKIYDKNNKITISYKAHSGNVKSIIKTQDNHLISCGNNGYIKIWPIFDDNIFKNLENNTIINVKPLFEFYIYIKEIKDIQKMVYINETSFLTFSDNNIFLYNYIIKDEKKEFKIDLLKIFNKIELIDLIIIKKENKESLIAAYNQDELYLLNINNLDIIKSIKLNNTKEKNCLIQLNENEMMIAQEKGDLLILDIDKLIIKLKYNNNTVTEYLYKLKDETLIQSGPSGIRRIMIKNIQELPILYTPFNDTVFDHPYKVYEKITCLKELSNGYIIKCVVIGTIYLCEFLFI